MDLNFELYDSDGEVVTNKELVGSWSVLYFYPKGESRGCVIKSQDFTLLKDKFDKFNCKVIGISPNSVEANKKFADKYSLRVTLLSDEKRKFIRQLGVLKIREVSGYVNLGAIKVTYIVDPNLNVVKEYTSAKVSGHAMQVLNDLAILQKDYKN